MKMRYKILLFMPTRKLIHSFLMSLSLWHTESIKFPNINELGDDIDELGERLLGTEESMNTV